MAKALSMKILTAACLLTCFLYFSGLLGGLIGWMNLIGLDIAFRVLAIYLFLYWTVVEVKDSYLLWKYREGADS